jgi:hypothetical protein
MVADQLKELKLGELLDTPPPGLDEAVAIAKVVQFVNSQVGADFHGSGFMAGFGDLLQLRGWGPQLECDYCTVGRRMDAALFASQERSRHIDTTRL